MPLIVLGNGPSLRGFNFEKLAGLPTLGMNAAYRHWDRIGFRPTYYACLDTVVGLSHKDAIARLIAEAGSAQRLLLRDNLIREVGPAARDDPRVYNFDWLRRIFALLGGEDVTTGSHATLWGALMGHRDIVLLGIDGSYEDKIAGGRTVEGIVREIVADAANPNYYFDDYQQVGDRYHQPNSRPNLHGAVWRRVRDLLESRGIRILNGSPASKLDVFERRPFDACVSP